MGTAAVIGRFRWNSSLERGSCQLKYRFPTKGGQFAHPERGGRPTYNRHLVARVLSTAVVLALLTATALAFVITERAKLEKSPIMGTNVTPLFSPSAVDPKLKNAEVIFRLRTTERIEVWIQDHEGNRVRDLQAPRTFRHGSRLDLVWDGFTDSGVLVPDGVYVPVVKLLRSHRTIVLPSEIKLDTKPPVITVHHPQYPIISPDGDGRHDRSRRPTASTSARTGFSPCAARRWSTRAARSKSASCTGTASSAFRRGPFARAATS